MKKKIIAKNPLSENLARVLGYYDHSPKGFTEILVSKAMEITRRFPDKTLSSTTILSWMEASKDDPAKACRIPYLDNLAMLATVLNIDDPWDLFVSDKYLNLKKIELARRNIIEVIGKINPKHLLGVTAYLKTVTEEESSDLFNLLSDYNPPDLLNRDSPPPKKNPNFS